MTKLVIITNIANGKILIFFFETILRPLFIKFAKVSLANFLWLNNILLYDAVSLYYILLDDGICTHCVYIILEYQNN